MPRKNAVQETFLDYEVEFLSKDPKKVAYHLYGPRGAIYYLHRNYHNPNLMFAINRSGNVVRLQGYSWFTDRKGYLQALD